MKIENIQVLTKLHGVDKVILQLDATTPFPEMNYEASANVEVAAGYGFEWARNNFPDATIETTDCETGIIKTVPKKEQKIPYKELLESELVLAGLTALINNETTKLLRN